MKGKKWVLLAVIVVLIVGASFSGCTSLVEKVVAGVTELKKEQLLAIRKGLEGNPAISVVTLDKRNYLRIGKIEDRKTRTFKWNREIRPFPELVEKVVSGAREGLETSLQRKITMSDAVVEKGGIVPGFEDYDYSPLGTGLAAVVEINVEQERQNADFYALDASLRFVDVKTGKQVAVKEVVCSVKGTRHVIMTNVNRITRERVVKFMEDVKRGDWSVEGSGGTKK